MASELKGRTALVTGAGKRIGREISLALAGEGVNVIVHYSRSLKEAEELKDEVAAKGVKSWLVKADFDKKEYEGLVERAAAATGGIDILVNNASIFPMSRLDGITLEGLFSNLRVNAWAPFELTRDLRKLMKKGRVVNLIDSRTQGYDWSHVEYILSKHLLAELTKMMAIEYAPDVVVNGVNPGLILPPPGKDMDYLEKMDSTVPRKRHGNPKDISDAVLYLLKSDFLIGEVINVDGGRHLMEYDRGPHPD
ncbi:glucose 1-dehydrogenase [uncultured bacterium]|nr:glucose 1-dehydrogenase [uncultured bacterium]